MKALVPLTNAVARAAANHKVNPIEARVSVLLRQNLNDIARS